MKCKYNGCKVKITNSNNHYPKTYALYQLHEDGTKKWVNVCDKHDRIVNQENDAIKRNYPDMKFKEA